MSHKSAPSTPVSTIGIDLGKNSFHLVGLDQRGAIVLQLGALSIARRRTSRPYGTRAYYKRPDEVSTPSKSLASLRSRVSKPSLNQP